MTVETTADLEGMAKDIGIDDQAALQKVIKYIRTLQKASGSSDRRLMAIEMGAFYAGYCAARGFSYRL